MGNHILSLFLLLCSWPGFALAAEKEVIPAKLAAGRAGEKATVEFKVEAGTLLSDRDEPICFLNSMKNFRSKDNFTVVIFSEALEKFEKAQISNTADHFKDKKVQVTGEIGLRQGKAQIIVEYVGQIEIVED